MTGDQDALFEVARHDGLAVGYVPVGTHAARLARLSDASSSHEAARDQVDSGRVATHGDAIESALRSHPWATSLELIDFEGRWLRKCGVDRVELARRLSGLLRSERVVRLDPDANSSIRPCRASHLKGSRCHRWALVADAWRASEVLTDPNATPVIDRGQIAAEGDAPA